MSDSFADLAREFCELFSLVFLNSPQVSYTAPTPVPLGHWVACSRINPGWVERTRTRTNTNPYGTKANAAIVVVKSAKAGLREQEARRTEIPRAERRPVVQAKRSGEQLLASN